MVRRLLPLVLLLAQCWTARGGDENVTLLAAESPVQCWPTFKDVLELREKDRRTLEYWTFPLALTSPTTWLLVECWSEHSDLCQVCLNSVSQETVLPMLLTAFAPFTQIFLSGLQDVSSNPSFKSVFILFLISCFADAEFLWYVRRLTRHSSKQVAQELLANPVAAVLRANFEYYLFFNFVYYFGNRVTYVLGWLLLALVSIASQAAPPRPEGADGSAPGFQLVPLRNSDTVVPPPLVIPDELPPGALDSFFCPITKEIMRLPCVVGGRTYEWEAIHQEAAKPNPVDPLTRKPLDIGSARVNWAIRGAIEEWLNKSQSLEAPGVSTPEPRAPAEP